LIFTNEPEIIKSEEANRMPVSPPSLLDHVLVAVFILGGLYAVLVGQRKMKGMTLTPESRISIFWSNGILLWVAGIATCAVWMIGARPLAALGLTLQYESIASGAVVALGFIAWYGVETWRGIATPARREEHRRQWARDVPMLPESPRELRHFSFLAIAAGVNEEIIARGFLISYFVVLLGDSSLAVAVAVALPAIGFGLAHLYQGWKPVLHIIVLSGALGAIYVVTKSLLIPMVLHVLIDLIGGYISLRLHQGDASTGSGGSECEPVPDAAPPIS
jgi:uncharacterized protein